MFRPSLRRWLFKCARLAGYDLWQPYSFPPPGQIDFGDLRQTEVLGRVAGTASYQEVTGYYIEQFFRCEARLVQGRVLKVDHARHTSGIARSGKAVSSLGFTDEAELIHHLADIEDNSYDALMLIQVLQVVYNLDAVVRHVHRILAPGGILLATVPGTCCAAYQLNEMKPYWGFTEVSLRKLIESVFPGRGININTHGNVRVAMVALHRLSLGELTQKDLNHKDKHYPLLLTLQARKKS